MNIQDTLSQQMKALSFTNLLRVIVLTAIYFVGGLLGKESSFMAGNVVLVWPPAGIALAAILLFGYSFWPGVALGAFLFSFVNGTPLGFFTFGTAIGNTVGAIICVFLLERLIDFRKSMDRVKDVAGFIILACVLGTTVNAAFNVVSESYPEIDLSGLFPKMFAWWVPNALAGLVVAPFILAWGTTSRTKWTTPLMIEAAACASGLALAIGIAFSSNLVQGKENYTMAYITFPFLIWGSLRFGLRGATTGTLFVSAMAIYQLLQSRGPFYSESSKDSLMLLGSYIGIISVMNLLLASAASERELAEQAMSESEKRYRAVVDDQTELICRVKPDGTLTFANEAYCRFHGKTIRELQGTLFMSLVAKEDRERILALIAKLTPEQPTATHNYKLVDRDGHILYQHCTIRQLFNEQTQTVDLQAVVHDITELKRAEDALRKSEEMFHLISNNVQDLIAVTDSIGKRLYNSPNYRTIFGTDLDIQGTDAFFQIHPEDRERVKQVFKETVATGTGKRCEYRFLLNDGSVRYIESQGSYVQGEPGQPGKVVTVARDITERRQFLEDIAKARDSALSSARLKAEFLANMSHEIRTPINGVIGMTNLLLHTDLNKRQRDYTETIRNSADSLLTIINDILDFSKIEAGKLTFEMLDFDLFQAVEGTLDLQAERAHAKGIELAAYVRTEVPAGVRGDPGRVRQILTNLVSNAIKFTHAGEVVVNVSRESETDTHSVVRFEVTDTGIGIPADAQARLFQAFSQADGSTTRKYGGTGLGLAICKQLAEMMHGKIGINSEPGKGSTFWFVIPFEKMAGPPKFGIKPKPTLEHVHVLVVDDNATNRQILMNQTQAWRMRTASASSGWEALELLRKSAYSDPFKIGLIDLQMPEMDGLALARSIKANPAIANIRLIMLTSLGQQIEQHDLNAAGIDACLDKPVKQSHLMDCLANVMGTPAQAVRIVKPTPPAPPAHPRPETQNVRILIAEDNAINQKVALAQLEELGYTADAVANGLEAVESIKRIPYDIILMDCQMPEMDGYEATRCIRQMRNAPGLPATVQNLHIIAMTANAMQGDREKCLAAGMDDYLSKPVQEDELQSALERWQEISTKRSKATAAVAERPVAPTTRAATPAPAASAAAAQAPPVDMNRLSKVTSGDARRMRELIKLYLTQAQELIKTLETAVQQNSPEDVQYAAHKLGGASASCGMNSIVPTLREMERQGREGKLTDADKHYEQAKQQLDRIESFLNDYLQSSNKA